LDDPDLAVCLNHRRACIFNAVQMVSSERLTPNLALGHELMFDHTVLIPAKIYGDDCHVQ
jgi:hypothetical protein